MNRYDARENAFSVVFSSHFQSDVETEELLSLYIESQEIESNDYFRKLVCVVRDNITAIDALIESKLSNWKLHRISKVALAALRVGVAEIRYIEETPGNVAINEAVEIAKKYEDQKCGNFVSGILSAIIKEQ